MSGLLRIKREKLLRSKKKNFWNATNVCCDFDKTGVDDATYLSNLIKEIQAEYKIDPKRVYLIGHSNGGYMSNRMACDHADQIAGIVSLAGSTWADQTKCKPKDEVSVLLIHGTEDDAVKYKGGTLFGGKPTYPGAVDTAKIWAKHNGCKATTVADPKKLDLDTTVDGAETEILRHEGCPKSVGVELWTLKGGGHLPMPTPAFTSKTWAFLKAHPKP